MNITICSFSDLDQYVDNNTKFDAIVSIMNPSESCNQSAPINKKRRSLQKISSHIYYFNFLDVRGRKDTHPDAPDEEDIESMQKTAKEILFKKHEQVLVHCQAGVSRSAAFAYILLREQGLNAEIAHQEILKVRSVARPSPRIIYLYELLVFEKLKTLKTKQINHRTFISF